MSQSKLELISEIDDSWRKGYNPPPVRHVERPTPTPAPPAKKPNY